MKKSKSKTVRFDEHTMLHISELSNMLKIDISTIIRVLCIHSINNMQDEKGNWKLPKQFVKQKKIKSSGQSGSDDCSF